MSETIKLRTPLGKALFPKLAEPDDNFDKGKYTLTMVFDPDAVKPIQDAIAKAGLGKGNSPLKQIPEDAEYDAGKFKLKAKSTFAVKVVDRDQQRIEPGRVTTGATVAAVVSFAPYNTPAIGKGVTCYLNSVLLWRDGMGGDDDWGNLAELEDQDLTTLFDAA